ncbi:MAG: chromosomal replication initiator DnaA [Candidatus Cloacimonas sp. 4484_209]|nr:MAG: chromosomal replication initiator DnaA [Candidatus Cloacimonas sp. 4484_209]
MARALRLSFENAFYHVTARGIRKENIFYSDKDKKVFLDKMNETFDKYSFVLYAYCLMDNHYHLFIKTPFANISQGMHYLNTSYANWFRAKHKLMGTIFQGRYKSILVDEDSYALVLSAYIHLNPLRAGMVENIEDYPFSSFLDYIGKRSPLVRRLDMSLILNMLSNDIKQSQKRYQQFVMENVGLKNPLEKSYKNIALGNEKFIERIKNKIDSLGQNREVSRIKDVSLPSKEKIIDIISKQFRVEKDKIFEKRRGNIYRKLTLYFLKKYSALSLKQIGELFDMDYVAVSQSAKRFENEMKKNKIALKMAKEVAEVLKKGNKCQMLRHDP